MKKNKLIFLLSTIIFLLNLNLNATRTKNSPKNRNGHIIHPIIGIIKTPIADLRTRPEQSPYFFTYPVLSKQNIYQDSQLLFGEKVEIIGEDKKWIKIKSLEQPTRYDFNEETKKYYATEYKTGWIKKDQIFFDKNFPNPNSIIISHNTPVNYELRGENKTIIFSIGTKIHYTKLYDNGLAEIILPNNIRGFIHRKNLKEITSTKNLDEIRKNIIKYARSFLDTPYSWGGKSSYNPQNKSVLTGVDCSSLVHLVYSLSGTGKLNIPRDSHDQYLASKEISKNDLQNGDLIFVRNKITQRVRHVVIYEKTENPITNECGEIIIETTGEIGTQKKCQIVEYEDFIKKVKNNEEMLFGSFLL